MPKRAGKSKAIVEQAFHEVKSENIPRKQKIAIALSKARQRGASVPKKGAKK